VLTSQLEASLMAEEQVDLSQAIDEHAALLRRQPAPAPTRPGDPDRTEELRGRSGWAWLRPFRRYDDYVRALDRAESASAEHAAERGLVEA
jgi:hypothetical protein